MATSASQVQLEALRARWVAAAEAGRLEEAYRLVEEAWRWAEREADPETRDRLLCNRAALALELGRGTELLPELRTLLLRGGGRPNYRLAAYTLARAYELRREAKKGLFYAKLSFETSLELGERDWIVSSQNQIGNLLAADGQFAEAAAAYEAALILESSPLPAAVAKYNLGYCQAVLGDVRAGLRNLLASVRALARLGAGAHEARARLDLAFAWIEAGRPERAERHGARALEAGRRLGEPEIVRNAFFLLGRAAQKRGDADSARFFFRQLQSDFYPDADYLVDLMVREDLGRVINLKA
ncbi:MAG TPA: hypothetical protein VLA75_10650 [Thermoanaerobaculia bacterium]|nr:hypothetical protein [Thermoanaerobaculia bacterium]